MKKLSLLIISMTPIIELRGSIPYSQIMKIPLRQAFIISIFGNIIIIPFIYYFINHILNWFINHNIFANICNKILEKGHKLGEKLQNKVGIGIYITLLLFVAIPIPGTGVWTAAIASSLLGLPFKKVFMSLSIGVIIAGILISILSYGIITIWI